MHTLPDLVIIPILFATVFTSLWIGLRVGRWQQRKQFPEQEHLGTIQGAILGLLGLVLGFSFSGAMGRFVDRQDALAIEANAIQTAFERADLLPNAQAVQQHLREYATLRLELFRERRPGPAAEITARMLDREEAARRAVLEGVHQSPQFAALVIPGLEAVGDEFVRRTAFDRRHLPSEMILVLILSSGLSMGTIGYGFGLADRQRIGPAIALAALIAITLFITIDFDRPRRGFISLDGTPLENAIRAIHAATPTP